MFSHRSNTLKNDATQAPTSRFDMKILVLNSSLRKNGNTERVIDILVEELKQKAGKDAGFQIHVVRLGDLHIEPCRGCRICFDRGDDFCPIKDDMREIKARVKEADALLLASPVYVDDVNGVMKNWIDRLAHVCHRPEFGGKSAFLLATVGSSRCSHALRTMDTALRTWGFHIIGKSGFKTHALMDRETIADLYGNELRSIAVRIFTALKKKSFMNPSFISLMFFKIVQTSWSSGDPETIDYQYWKKQGWLDKRCSFFIAHEAHPVKVAVARAVGRLIARVAA